MSKMICFSFDDGRRDTYTRAFKIMNRYGLCGTIHITTGFIDGTWKRKEEWDSAGEGPMTLVEIQRCKASGFEISSHGNEHLTEEEDLKQSLHKLCQWGVMKEGSYTFSVPHSKVRKEDRTIYKACNLQYVRVGRAKACYGLWGKFLYVLQRQTHWRYPFYLFNKPNFVHEEALDPYHLTATVVKQHNTADQLIYFIEKMAKYKGLNILMFHSILYPDDKGYGKDSWYMDATEFEKLCCFLKQHPEIEVVTMKEGVKRCTLKNGELVRKN